MRALIGIELDEKTYTQLRLLARDASVTPEELAAQMVAATVILNLPNNSEGTPEAIREELRIELKRRGFQDV